VGFCGGISQHDPQNRSVAAYVAKESRKDAQDYFPTEIALKLAAPIRPNLKVPMEGFLIISLLLTGGPVRQHLLKFRLR
jgi:hypothetical protein